MKILASLFRVLFSIILLLALACYLQTPSQISLGQFCLTIDPAYLLPLLSGFNTVTVSLVIILLLGIFSFTRVLEAAWNVLFCASIIALLALGLYEFAGPAIALPQAIHHNAAVNQFCQAVTSYEVPIALTTLIFIAGWLCSSACVSVALTAVISYGLWYAITVFFTYLVHQWADSATPGMPEALHMIQSSPWVIAAVPGAFFLIYALLMAFFETFIATGKKPAATRQKSPAAEEKPAEEKKDESPAAPAEPAAKSKPILKAAGAAPATTRKIKTAADAAAEPSKAEKAPAPAIEENKPETAEAPAENTAATAEEPLTPEKADTPTPAVEETKPETAPAQDEAQPAPAETRTTA